MAVINLGRVGYVHKGAYAAATTYQKYDVVLYNHGSYLYIGDTASQGHAPTETAYWQAMLDPNEMNAATEAAVAAADAAHASALELAGQVDRLTTPFSITGDMVNCHPVSDYPLGVISHIAPVQAGSGDPSPTNVRPISGWTGAKLDITNDNLLGGMHLAKILQEQSAATIDTSAGTVTFASIEAGNKTLIKNVFKPGKQYTIILYGRNIGGKHNAANIAFSYSDGTYDSVNFPSLTENSYLVYTSPYGKNVKSVFSVMAADTTVLYYDMCGVFEGVISSYSPSPSHGKRHTAQFGQTIYGGELDWKTGVLTSSYNKIVFDGVTVGRKVDGTDPGVTTYAYLIQQSMPKPLKNNGRAYV